jgi:predicted small secreted protein
MRALITLLVAAIALLLTGCEKNIKEGVNQREVPSELASAK